MVLFRLPTDTHQSNLQQEMLEVLRSLARGLETWLLLQLSRVVSRIALVLQSVDASRFLLVPLWYLVDSAVCFLCHLGFLLLYMLVHLLMFKAQL